MTGHAVHEIEINVQSGSGGRWSVVMREQPAEGGLPVRSEGSLVVDPAALEVLSPEESGVRLGEALFREDIRDAFQRALRESKGELHVIVRVEDDGLKSLRWERLCAPLDHGSWRPLALDQRVPYSIGVESRTDLTYTPVDRGSLRALVVVACPRGLGQWKLTNFDESAAVRSAREGLGPIPSDVLGRTGDAIGPPSLDALCMALTDRQYTLLHVVAHGMFQADDGESSLMLERTEDSGVDRVAASRLVGRLTRVGGSKGLPRFVFLGSCESADWRAECGLGGFGRRLVRDLGVHAVLAMTDQVTEKTVLALSKAFYRHLLAHGKPDLALAESYADLAERSDVAVPVPALFSRASAVPLFRVDAGPDPFNAATAIAPTLATTVVDFMRLVSIAVSDGAREANELRYPEFLELARYHFDDFRSLLAQFPDKLDPSIRELSVKVQRKLSWAYLELRRGPHLPGTPKKLFQVMNDVIEMSSQFFVKSEEYITFRELVQTLVARSRAEAVNDVNGAISARFSLQSQALAQPYVTNQARMRSIREDVDQVNNVLYFIIDSFIIKILARL